ncbi:MAG: tRNA (adenosine(37)-N6)-threonylcarbamoyltransferase complex transferase subunit TsaD [Candidatus Micrarchaeota archaeon]|nr:tRNA (adenosine(37)-N6)-threonylcarbamoyltransferase complex transferase subunit TsaD [Candidatus Micrarchaeota archaeon]
MRIIGIESSAHTLGIGIVSSGKVLANKKLMYDVGTTGMIPNKVAEFHIGNISTVIKAAVEGAGIRITDIDGVGYTRGPGLGPCLSVGQLAAKTIAATIGVPIAPVNHGIGHIEIAKAFSHTKDPLVIYVSGGNSQILKRHGRRYRVLGETFDIGIGNMFDSFARKLKLSPAWGSTVEKKAKGGRYMAMPFTVKGMDFSFTGLQTHAAKLAGKASENDVCFSLRETAFAMVCEAAERAILLTNSRELIVCGGVAQSARLQEMLHDVAREHRVRFGFAPNEYNADNGAMIAYVAERMLQNGADTPLNECDIEQRYRLENVVVY